MSKRTPNLLIEDIIGSANKILKYTHNISFEEFTNDRQTMDAVIRNFEIIGEAANGLPEDFKHQHSNIDWHHIRGLGKRIVHDYLGIDYSIVWEIKNTFLLNMIQKLKSINW